MPYGAHGGTGLARNGRGKKHSREPAAAFLEPLGGRDMIDGQDCVMFMKKFASQIVFGCRNLSCFQYL